MTKHSVRISDQLELPLEAFKDLIAIVARRGRGKTYSGCVIAEELLKLGQQVAILDPMDVWFGLRSSADGKGEGFPVVIFGGDHADVDLTPDMGKQVADFLVTESISAIIVPDFETNQDTVEFMTAVLDRLLKANREPLHLFFDEAEAFAPERPAKYEQRMLGAMGRLVKRGRVRGLFPTLITQRTASINKNTISQAAGLFAMALSSPWDRAPVERWMASNGTPEQMDMVKADLASLPVGEGWFWHPDQDIFQRIKIRTRDTFDSSATPETGAKSAAPSKWSEIDIEKVGERMRAAVERAKAEDPAELKKQIAQLKRQLQATPKEAKPLEVEVPVEVPVPLLAPADVARLERALEGFDKIADRFAEEAAQVSGVASAFREHLAKLQDRPEPTPSRAAPKPRPSKPRPVAQAPASEDTGNIGKSHRKVLAVLAQFPEGRTISQLALLSGYRISGGFRNILSALRTAGFMVGANTATMQITEQGLDFIAGDYEHLPSGDALVDYWVAKLPEGDGRVLRAFLEHGEMNIEEVAEAAGYQVSGGFRNILSRLRTLNLIEGRNVETMRVHPDFMEMIS